VTTFVAFLLFEVCVGMYWPLMWEMKAKVIPEDVRATVLNLFRVPLNLYVVTIMLLRGTYLTQTHVIYVACGALALAAAVQAFVDVDEGSKTKLEKEKKSKGSKAK